MTYPRLLARSNISDYTIPNPHDFELDAAVKQIMRNPLAADDFVSPEKVLSYAKGHVYNLEQDPDAIQSRQQNLQTFMANPQFTTWVSQNGVTPYERSVNERWRYEFGKRKQRAREYLDCLEGLVKLPVEGNVDAEKLQIHFNDVYRNERTTELRNIIREIDTSQITEMSGSFSTHRWNSTNVKYDNAGVDVIVQQTRGPNLTQHVHGDQNWQEKDASMPYERMFDEMVRVVKEKKGFDLNHKTCHYKITVDSKNHTVSCKVTYEAFNIWDSLRAGFKKKSRTVSVPVEFAANKINAGDFEKVSDFVMNEQLGWKLATYDQEIDELAEPMTELRYLANAALHFTQQMADGEALVKPKLLPQESKETRYGSLKKPTLIRKHNNVISNNYTTQPETTITTVTGPNNNGKTTFMDSIGIAQAFTQAGLLVTAQSAEVSPKDTIYSHYIRQGDIQSGESRYAHELSRIRGIFQKITPNSLLLMDESCSGTAHEDALQEMTDVLEVADTLGNTTIGATHLHELADVTDRLHGQNLHCVANETPEDKLEYTYRIEDGASSKSEGTYLAKEMEADKEGLLALLEKRGVLPNQAAE